MEKNGNLDAIAESINCKRNTNVVYKDENLIMIQTSGRHSAGLTARLYEDVCVIFGCMKGTLIVELPEKTMVLKTNDVMVMRSGITILSMESDDEFEGVGVGLSTGILQLMFHRGKDIQRTVLRLLRHPVVKVSDEGLGIFSRYRDLMIEKLQNNSHRPYLKKTVTYIMCAMIYELFAEIEGETPIDDETKGLKQGDLLFMRFITLLDNEEMPNRSLSYYANLLCVTPKYLSFVCKQVSGKTAKSWINEYMSSKLRYCLEHTDMSVKEIANRYDFPSLSFLGKYVKKLLGCSPTEYRKKIGRN